MPSPKFVLSFATGLAIAFRLLALWQPLSAEHATPRVASQLFDSERIYENETLLAAISETEFRRIYVTDSHTEVLVSAWDPEAIVYVAAGEDGAPGVAGVDDDGNAVVDDVSELGATGSDDQVLTPENAGYQEAASGKILASVLSRGAMLRVEGQTEISAPGQVRIDVIDSQNRMTSKIIDLK